MTVSDLIPGNVLVFSGKYVKFTAMVVCEKKTQHSQGHKLLILDSDDQSRVAVNTYEYISDDSELFRFCEKIAG
jgi:hypothetical protein